MSEGVMTILKPKSKVQSDSKPETPAFMQELCDRIDRTEPELKSILVDNYNLKAEFLNQHYPTFSIPYLKLNPDSSISHTKQPYFSFKLS